MKPRFGLLLAFTVSAAFLVIGCDSSGTSSDDPPEQEEEGSVSFALARAENSSVPSDADSAFVRIWQPDGNFNLSDLVNIPDPGQQTEVSFDVPADQGYRAGVMAVTGRKYASDGYKTLEAHGSSDKFTVTASDTSQVNLDPRVADLTLEVPESIPPNRTDTIRAVYALNPPNANPEIGAAQDQDPSFDMAGAPELSTAGGSNTDTTVARNFEVIGPDVDTEDTTYVKVEVLPDVHQGTWLPSNIRGLTYSFFPTVSGQSFAIPVVPGSGDDDGTVIITFSRSGDGWERTRRVVE